MAGVQPGDKGVQLRAVGWARSLDLSPPSAAKEPFMLRRPTKVLR